MVSTYGLDIKLSVHFLIFFFSRRCAPCAPPSTTTLPPPMWSLTWSGGGKQRPNVAPTFCDNPSECHHFIVFKAVIWVIPNKCQYTWEKLTKWLSSSVFPLIFCWWLLCDNVVIYDNITLILPAWPEFLWRHMRQSVPAWSRILFIFVGNNLNIPSLPDRISQQISEDE